MNEKPKMLLINDSEEIKKVIMSSIFKNYILLNDKGEKNAISSIKKYGKSISIILLNIISPKKTAINLLKWIKNSEYSSIPVIVVTKDERYQLEALNNGAADFISCTTDAKIFETRIENVLARLELEQAKQQASLLQLYDNLVNESSNAVYVSDVNNYNLLYINDTGINIFKKEGKSYVGRKCYEYLFDRTSPCNFCKMNIMKDEEYLKRVFEYSFYDKVYCLRGKLTNWNGIRVHVEYIEDITENRKITQKNKELMDQIASLIEYMPGGMCLYCVDQNGIRPFVHNQAFYDIFGYSEENIKSVEMQTDYLNVHPDDIDELRSKINEAISASYQVSHTYRIFNDRKGKYIWIYLNGIVIDQPDNTKLCYISYTDVTQERETHEQLLYVQKDMQLLIKKEEKALNSYRTLVNTVPGGIAMYEIDGDKIKTRFYSNGLCELSGYSKEEREVICKDDAMALTYEEDVPILRETLNNAVENKLNIDLTYRIKTKSGKPRWINLRATYSSSDDGKPAFHAVFTDVNKMKKIEEAEKEQQLRYAVALKSSGVNVWEYDIQADVLTIISNSSRVNQNCSTIENYIDSTVKGGYVREDSVDDFYNIFKRLKNGEKEVTEDIWYKSTDEAGWWCERIIYTTVFDTKGKPVKAFGAGREVTREKEAIKKFDEEMSYRAAMQEANIDSLKINLTQNTIIDGDSPFRVLNELIDGNDADRYFLKTVDYILGEKNKQGYKERFNRKNLLSCFNRGDYSLSMEFTRVFDTNRIYWIKYNVHLMKNPETKDVIAFIIANDITDENVMKSIMNTIARTDYDFFVVVDGTTNTAVDYTISSGKRLFTEQHQFEERNEMLIRRVVCEEDVERVVNECQINNVLKNIGNGNIHKFDFNMREKNGEIRRKQLHLTLIDLNRKAFLMTRIDVTGIYNEQVKHQKELEMALISAKQANLAKSDFLARMSHDIRTPMNAIIGMAELAQDQQNTPETNEYLKNIDASSQFLLGLINDILDLSKIESGKIKLFEEPFTLNEFKRNVNTVILPLMNAKHIDFLFNINCDATCIMVDKLRYTQIYFNLLSNAVKFTPEGGYIEFTCDHIPDRDGKYGMRCSVRDNGIGMSEEFLKHLFEPFSQEITDANSFEQGTGLGLAIVKNLVDAMGGSIKVTSSLGKGTEFVVELYVNIAQSDSLQKELANHLNIDLSRTHILLVEDNNLNIVVAKRLLERSGCNVDVAVNGKEAVEMFMKSNMFFYDAILMDVRMPILGGIEATKQIRLIEREDSRSIPIIAMTADAFAEDEDKTKRAGMNAHLSKPIDPKLLYSTIYSLIYDSNATKKEK